MGAAQETRYKTERELRFGAFLLIQRSSWCNSGKTKHPDHPRGQAEKSPRASLTVMRGLGSSAGRFNISIPSTSAVASTPLSCCPQ